MRLLLAAVLLMLSALPQAARAEDGYRLWLRFDQLSPEQVDRHGPYTGSISGDASSATLALARSELQNGLQGLLGRRVPLLTNPATGTVLIGTPRSSRQIAALRLPLARLGREGFLLRSLRTQGGPRLIVAANKDIGVLSGVLALLRRAARGRTS